MVRIPALFTAMLALAAAAVPAGGEAPGAGLPGRLLDLHNQAREAERLPGLVWSDELAKSAEPWARQLAQDGFLRHSSQEVRGATGENLWMGSAGFFAPDDMIGAFVSEKSAFRPGIFPNVSTTGNWQDVGHYTQIIWPQTQQVGCAIARGNGMDVLVCRYWPAGNWMGRPVG